MKKLVDFSKTYKNLQENICIIYKNLQSLHHKIVINHDRTTTVS